MIPACFSVWCFEAGASGCDWPRMWSILLCGLCSLCFSHDLDIVSCTVFYGTVSGIDFLLYAVLWPGLCGALYSLDNVPAYACFYISSIVIVITNQDSTSSRLLPMNYYAVFLVPCC
jgi:hypothetical protein